MGEWISTLNGGEWSASRPSSFIPGEKPQYSLDRRLGGPQRLFERCEEKNLTHTAVQIPAIQPAHIAMPTNKYYYLGRQILTEI
jgi:hypothetical protein